MILRRIGVGASRMRGGRLCPAESGGRLWRAGAGLRKFPINHSLLKLADSARLCLYRSMEMCLVNCLFGSHGYE